ncbi:hypothetical protein ACJX0J_006270, partial [Zea mays]
MGQKNSDVSKTDNPLQLKHMFSCMIQSNGGYFELWQHIYYNRMITTPHIPERGYGHGVTGYGYELRLKLIVTDLDPTLVCIMGDLLSHHVTYIILWDMIYSWNIFF